MKTGIIGYLQKNRLLIPVCTAAWSANGAPMDAERFIASFLGENGKSQKFPVIRYH